MAARIAIVGLLCVAGCTPSTGPPPPVSVIEPFDGVRVRPDAGVVEVEAFVCLDEGWLEQVACSPDTREHETLVVIKVRPSNLHAALLMGGFKPGSPGRWSYDDQTITVTPPTGDRVDIVMRYQRDGRVIEEPAGAWIIGVDDDRPFPDRGWVFAGSSLAVNPEWMGPGEHYVADLTGSIIGLVTFGDEVIAFEQVMSDQESIEPMQWRINTGHVPAIGTPVTVILRAPPPGS